MKEMNVDKQPYLKQDVDDDEDEDIYEVVFVL